jgi:CubicO group peptidase (beta-lactamase class C family)
MLRLISFATGVTLALLPAATLAQTTLTPTDRATLDSVVDQLVGNQLVPGISLLIVDGERVIYRRDAGWADRESGRRVDAGTVWYTASVTKPFTALATTMLDRDGILRLDATVAQILPGLALGNGLDPSGITVRQLLSHTHGITGDGPVLYRTAYSGEIDRSALTRAVAAHPARSTGTAYRYSNMGYNLLSLAIDSITRTPWQDVVRARVFRPLGLRSTWARVSEVPEGRLAMPHAFGPNGLERIRYGKHDDNMHAAGGIVATTDDLARFLMMEMNGGRVGARQAFPADVIAETQRPVASYSERAFEMQRFAYALGWNFGVYDGDTTMHHMGGFTGFAAGVSWMPGRRIGLVWATNGGVGQPTPLVGLAYALLTDKPEAAARYRGMIESVISRVVEGRAAIAADRARRAQRPQTMALPLERYVGRYEEPLWGSMVVTLRDGKLVVRNGVLEGVAEVSDSATHQIRVELEPGDGTIIAFQLTDDRATALEWRRMRFTRVP